VTSYHHQEKTFLLKPVGTTDSPPKLAANTVSDSGIFRVEQPASEATSSKTPQAATANYGVASDATSDSGSPASSLSYSEFGPSRVSKFTLPTRIVLTQPSGNVQSTAAQSSNQSTATQSSNQSTASSRTVVATRSTRTKSGGVKPSTSSYASAMVLPVKRIIIKTRRDFFDEDTEESGSLTQGGGSSISESSSDLADIRKDSSGVGLHDLPTVWHTYIPSLYLFQKLGNNWGL
jgi:hypothetical protein